MAFKKILQTEVGNKNFKKVNQLQAKAKKRKSLGKYNLSSSEPDPFATDHDSDDPDFVPSDTDHKSRGEQQHVDIERGNVKKKCRKKTRHTESWRRNVIRSSRNSGAEYVNWKGNVQSERKLKPPCQNCRNKCSEKFTEDERKSIFTNFWSLADINRQRDFLSKFVTAEEKQRCRKRPRIKDISEAGEGQVRNGEAAEKKQPKQSILYSYLSQKHSVKIRHTFLEPGHTQTEGACVHSVIEKASRHISVYTPQQWYSVVRTAKRKKPYYTVYELPQKDVYDLKVTFDHYPKFIAVDI
ncbi:hypothetical protein RN001_009543 [Aquatica leii]|uniref:Uncharacterized protein n=1 Tax=Aquatica leii TaxID=1421715 RepID=A0AAN7SDX7_9COLE|nr:hypothetical protein RN001_009543 [Aquatica leii]